MPWFEHISAPAAGLLEALLIGLIVGAQREAQKEKSQAGLRDFLLIALTGGVCGIIGQIWLTVTALLCITIFLAVYFIRAERRGGITTEMAAVATFAIAVLAATPAQEGASKLAVGAAIVVVAFLEAKRSLHRFVRQTLTETEFNDTIWFLAIIYIIYPLLPEGPVGPRGYFEPRQVWVFVILVSSISFVGYFLQKFLGTKRGLAWTAILGGLASTTAATLAFAREVEEEPDSMTAHWSAALTANAIQFPRVLLILYVVNQGLAVALTAVLLIMSAAGLLGGFLLHRRARPSEESKDTPTGNPFRLAPALKFGVMFAVIVVASRLAADEFGGKGLVWASALGGTMDADAVSVSVAGMEQDGTVETITARAVVLLALLMNAFLKTGLAAYAGGARFAWRVAAGFLLMFGVGAITLILSGGL